MQDGDAAKFIDEAKSWLDIYFDGREPGFTPKLHLIGTKFRLEVWNRLLEIPYGKTISYGEIARELAHRRGIERMAAQAVGGAVGHNDISIIVPCHRVIGSDGKLTGYGGRQNIRVKQYLQRTTDRFRRFFCKKCLNIPLGGI